MARRSRLTANALNIVGSDNGLVAVSVTEVTKTSVQVNLNTTQFTNIAGFTISASLVEADNVLNQESAPDDYRTGATRQTIPIVNRDDTNSTFQLYIDAGDLISGWSQAPIPGHPVYGFISCVIDDNGVNEQNYEIIRGRIEVLASPTAVAT